MTAGPNDQYHTIFLDVGGTMISAKPSVGAIYAEVAAKYDIHIDAEEMQVNARRLFFEMREREVREGAAPHTVSIELAKVWWRELVAACLGPAADSPRFDDYFEDVFDQFTRADRYQFFPEVEATVARLREAGFRLGILSNWDVRLRPVLEGLGAIPQFDPIVISAEVGCEKPDPKIYEIARRMAGAEAGQPLLMVGDSRTDDYEGALSAGFEARHLRRAEGESLHSVLEDLFV